MYLSIIDGTIGFKSPEINAIRETDVKISDEIYSKFFELQSQGKQFKVKNINGSTFEEVFEEVILNPVQQRLPSQEDRISALESAISTLMGV